MSLVVRTLEEKAVRYLKVEAGVRYWEDGKVNGKADDDDAPAMPFASLGVWRPIIDMETGRIEGWPDGTVADVHYKVCDAGRYALLDEDRNEVTSIEGYVPIMLSPGGQGYGDYIIMTIGPDGVIAGWRPDLDGFEED